MLPILFQIACTNSGPTIQYINLELEPFELVDVNVTSATYEQLINSHQFTESSPELVSAWYFGHAT